MGYDNVEWVCRKSAIEFQFRNSVIDNLLNKRLDIVGDINKGLNDIGDSEAYNYID